MDHQEGTVCSLLRNTGLKHIKKLPQAAARSRKKQLAPSTPCFAQAETRMLMAHYDDTTAWQERSIKGNRQIALPVDFIALVTISNRNWAIWIIVLI